MKRQRLSTVSCLFDLNKKGGFTSVPKKNFRNPLFYFELYRYTVALMPHKMQFSECGCDICIYFCKWSSPTLHSENRQFQYIWNSQYTVKKEMGNLRGIFGFGANPFLPLKGIISSYVTSRTLDSLMYEQYFPNFISVHYWQARTTQLWLATKYNKQVPPKPYILVGLYTVYKAINKLLYRK